MGVDRTETTATRTGGISMSDVDVAIEQFRKAIEKGDMESMGGALDAIAADDFVQEWPQSGERIRGEGNIRTIEMTIDYGDGTPVSYVGIAEFKDGKLAKQTEYFANPFPAPAWRADFVEKMEPVGAR